MRVAAYCRVSTSDQEPANQLLEIQRYVNARGWMLSGEFIDRGISGVSTSRPALDEMLRLARRRRLDGVVVWSLDRLGRNLRHLILTLDEMAALGVAFVSLAEGIDTSTPAGRLQLHVLGAIAEFERCRIAERVRAGVARARAEGKRLGRPRRQVPPSALEAVRGLSAGKAARVLGVSRATAHRWLSQKACAPTVS